MRYPDPFDSVQVDEAVRRISQLVDTSSPLWGRMNAAQMLAHLCVSYEMIYTDMHPRPNALVRLLLRLVAKRGVVGPKPYPKAAPTAPQFQIRDARNFLVERERLLAYIRRVRDEGRAAFEGRESPSFGSLSADEWAVLFGKHLDHHLRQFGV